ncbi:hypothetical protein KAI54_00840, partial [Candidatus Gracilibacteria bacterium]|nr:hypothetical protein [Candidatus Gracilibacteria bacterium]
MTEKNVDEWPSLLRKDGNKIKMHFPPGPDQKKFETVLKKFKKKKTEYLLKNEVVITPEQSAEAHEKVAEENRIKNFLDKNSGFEMEIKNKIDDLCNAPTDNSEKTIYENTLFFLEMSFRQLLVLDLKAAAKKGADLQKVAEESTKEWIAALEEMADGPTLEYHELLPQENEVYSPEAWKLVNDPQFRQEAGKLAETATKTTAKAADKKKFVSFYLEQWAEVTEDVNIEGATRFLNESHATMMREVGEGHLSLDEFREVWTEISKNTAAAELLKTAENSSASENFNEWLNDKDEALL